MLDETAVAAETTDTTSAAISDSGEGAVSTDEQVLTNVEETQGTGEVTETKTEETQPQPLEEIASSSTAPPEWLKSHYADPKVGKEAQRLWDTATAYRQSFPTVAAAKQAAEIVQQVGSIEDLKAAIDAASEKQNSDIVFESADPEQIGQLARDWAQNPDAYAVLASEGLKVLQETNPAKYQEIGREIFADTLENYYNYALRNRNTEAADRLDQLHKDVFGRAIGEARRIDPREQQITAKEQGLARQREDFQGQVVTSFANDNNQTAGRQIATDIKGVVSKALEGVKISAAARQRVEADIYNEINQTMIGNKNLQSRLQVIGQRVKQSGRFSPQDRQQWIAALQATAKSILPSTAQKIISQWTRDYLGVVKDKNAKISSAASRTDISGGGQPDMSLPALKGDKMLTMSTEELNAWKGPIDPNWKKQMQEARMKQL